MRQQSFIIEDMPADVAWVWSIQYSGQPVGMDIYNEMERIIDNYPNWFPWEHTYKTIPQEVHDAYNKEKDPNLGKSFEEMWAQGKGENEEGYIGLIPTIMKEKNYPLEPFEFTQGSLSDMFAALFQQEEERRIALIKKEKKDKKLWDKHYSKYGLEYRS